MIASGRRLIYLFLALFFYLHPLFGVPVITNLNPAFGPTSGNNVVVIAALRGM